MMRAGGLFVLAAAVVLLAPHAGFGQVLGACGTASENEPVLALDSGALTVMHVPLPGQYAINFELPAVLGDDIKKIKLSDYNNEWRVVCFYPADFTFV